MLICFAANTGVSKVLAANKAIGLFGGIGFFLEGSDLEAWAYKLMRSSILL